MICFGFLLAWLPYTVVSIIITYGPADVNISPKLTAFCALMVKFSNVYNPLLYVISKARYRQMISQEIKHMKDSILSASCPTRQTPTNVNVISIELSMQSGNGNNLSMSQDRQSKVVGHI